MAMTLVTRLGVLAGATAALCGYARYARPWMLNWGATPDEVSSQLAGDDLIVGQYVATHAITIARPPAQVWPWLNQMGYRRGGWYSYDLLEKSIGVGDFAEGGTARRILTDI